MTPPFDILHVERIARDIIADYELPVAVLMTLDDGDCWRLVVRDTHHRVLGLQILKTTLATTLREQLVTQLNAITPGPARKRG